MLVDKSIRTVDCNAVLCSDRSMSTSHQKNLFGSSVPFKSVDTTSESDPTSSSFDPVKLVLILLTFSYTAVESPQDISYYLVRFSRPNRAADETEKLR